MNASRKTVLTKFFNFWKKSNFLAKNYGNSNKNYNPKSVHWFSIYERLLMVKVVKKNYFANFAIFSINISQS